MFLVKHWHVPFSCLSERDRKLLCNTPWVLHWRLFLFSFWFLTNPFQDYLRLPHQDWCTRMIHKLKYNPDRISCPTDILHGREPTNISSHFPQVMQGLYCLKQGVELDQGCSTASSPRQVNVWSIGSHLAAIPLIAPADVVAMVSGSGQHGWREPLKPSAHIVAPTGGPWWLHGTAWQEVCAVCGVYGPCSTQLMWYLASMALASQKLESLGLDNLMRFFQTLLFSDSMLGGLGWGSLSLTWVIIFLICLASRGGSSICESSWDAASAVGLSISRDCIRKTQFCSLVILSHVL